MICQAVTRAEFGVELLKWPAGLAGLHIPKRRLKGEFVLSELLLRQILEPPAFVEFIEREFVTGVPSLFEHVCAESLNLLFDWTHDELLAGQQGAQFYRGSR